MYSYDDRIRAVELYIKLGKRVGPTIRQLGYPTKNALKGWYRAHQQRLDLPVGYARREPKFSQAQKAAAVEHYFAHDQCIAATTRALGYPCRATLTAWVREVLPKAHRADDFAWAHRKVDLLTQQLRKTSKAVRPRNDRPARTFTAWISSSLLFALISRFNSDFPSPRANGGITICKVSNSLTS